MGRRTALHVGSLAPFIGVIGTGGTYVTDVFFDAGRALELMERENVSVAWPWFPAILQPLLDHPTFGPARLAALRKVLLIAPPALVNRIQQTFPKAEFMQACGMTETAGIFALCAPDETPEQRAISQGKPVPGRRGRRAKESRRGSGARCCGRDPRARLLRDGRLPPLHREDRRGARQRRLATAATGDLYARAADRPTDLHRPRQGHAESRRRECRRDRG